MTLVHRVLYPTPIESLDEYSKVRGGRGLDAARRLSLGGDHRRARGDRVCAVAAARAFPTGRKWRTVRDYCSNFERTSVVVNAAEGEPGTFKDRTILRNDPYQVLEGALIAAHAVDADQIIVATKHSFAAEVDASARRDRRDQERGVGRRRRDLDLRGAERVSLRRRDRAVGDHRRPLPVPAYRAAVPARRARGRGVGRRRRHAERAVGARRDGRARRRRPKRRRRSSTTSRRSRTSRGSSLAAPTGSAPKERRSRRERSCAPSPVRPSAAVSAKSSWARRCARSSRRSAAGRVPDAQIRAVLPGVSSDVHRRRRARHARELRGAGRDRQRSRLGRLRRVRRRRRPRRGRGRACRGSWPSSRAGSARRASSTDCASRSCSSAVAGGEATTHDVDEIARADRHGRRRCALFARDPATSVVGEPASTISPPTSTRTSSAAFRRPRSGRRRARRHRRRRCAHRRASRRQAARLDLRRGRLRQVARRARLGEHRDPVCAPGVTFRLRSACSRNP